MIFVGNQERGYFSEEFAGKNGLDFAYVGTFPHIADQTNDILRHGKQDYTIFDVDTYIDEADEIRPDHQDMQGKQFKSDHICTGLYVGICYDHGLI